MQNVPLGILRLLLQILVVSFVVFYQLWYARGYQEFTEVEASVTTKVRDFQGNNKLQRSKTNLWCIVKCEPFLI